jgi:hypothetical protein
MASMTLFLVMLSVSTMGVVACHTTVKMFIALVPEVPSQLIEEKTTIFFLFFNTLC